MPEQSHFQNALSNFTHEVASGGAIRHLTDLGYTARQIAGQLQYPTPFGRVQQEMWQHLIETDVILMEEPGSRNREKISYVREYDKFGRSSFRRVVETVGDVSAPICWREHQIKVGESLSEEEKESMLNILQKNLNENGKGCSYASCDFGLLAYREPELFQRQLQVLDSEQREYVEGLPWRAQRVYHRLDSHMLRILRQLYQAGKYNGICYFIKTKDKLIFG